MEGEYCDQYELVWHTCHRSTHYVPRPRMTPIAQDGEKRICALGTEEEGVHVSLRALTNGFCR